MAASDDLTGAADQGGDWDLEVNVGTVEAVSLSAENWAGTLADTDGDGFDDGNDLDDDNDGILDTDEGLTFASATCRSFRISSGRVGADVCGNPRVGCENHIYVHQRCLFRCRRRDTAIL